MDWKVCMLCCESFEPPILRFYFLLHRAEERWSGQPTDGKNPTQAIIFAAYLDEGPFMCVGSHENAGKSGAQQQGQGGSGMQALPRPPPLTIPFDGSVSVTWEDAACMHGRHGMRLHG